MKKRDIKYSLTRIAGDMLDAYAYFHQHPNRQSLLLDLKEIAVDLKDLTEELELEECQKP